MTILEEKEKFNMNFQKTQNEKRYYLGEFKENVIAAINKKDISLEVEEIFINFMKRKDAVLLKINRKIEIKKIKKYIEYAEKINLSYRLVDDISFVGDVGMVIVAETSLDNKEKEVIIESERESYEKKGLSPYYSDNKGQKICDYHYKLLKEKSPENLKDFKKIGFIDKLLGYDCPICKKEKK